MKKIIYLLGLAIFSQFSYAATNAEMAQIAKILFNGGATNYSYNNWGACPNNWCVIKKAGYDGGHSGHDIQTTTTKGKETFYSVSKGEVITAAGSGAIAVYDKDRNITVLYLHASAHQVKVGDPVWVGKPIGNQGDVGATGAFHVHLEARTGKQTSAALGKPGTIDPIATALSYVQSIQVKDFWVKSAPIVANQTNGFDAQFKLTNSSSSTQTFAKVVLAIHDGNNTWVKDMKIFSNVSIAAGATWQTNIVATNSPNAGNYLVVAKVAKTGADWVNLDSKPFTVTAANKMASVKVACPATRLNVAQTSTCSATAYYSNGSNKPVTSTASTSWATNNSNAATVTTQGVVTAKGVASDTAVAVTASYNESGVTQQGAANLTVVGLDGKLPTDFGCTADQQTVASKAITGGSIVLMFSKKCGTNWARAITTNSTVATTVKITRASDNKNYPVSGKGTISTPMVYSPITKACASGKIGSVSVADNTVCR